MQDHETQERYGPDVNRRDFLKGSGVAVAATAVVSGAAEAQEAKTKTGTAVVGPKAQEITLNVNGKDHKLKVEPRTTLLDALRIDLGLTGCKEVCTTANCGACTVMVGGEAVYACTRMAVAEQKEKITTVEALTAGGKVDEVITAFVKHDATQCGFCTPGLVVAVKALVASKPEAKLDELAKQLGGNLCRCGTYHGVCQAALELAKKGGA